MKTRLLALAFCIALKLPAQPAEISIQLDGYNALVHKNFIEIELSDVNFPKKTQLQLLENGTVIANPVIDQNREIMVTYDDREIPLLIAPGDHVKLQINTDSLLVRNTTEAKVTGAFQVSNTLILKHLQTMEGWFFEASNAFAVDKTMPEEDYLALRWGEMQTHLRRLDTLARKEQISDPFFMTWASSWVRYEAAHDLCVFPFLGKRNNKASETDAYFHFVGTMEPANAMVATFRSFTDYVRVLAGDFQIIGGISDKYAEQRQTLRASGQSSFPIIFQIVSRLPPGAQRESAMIYIFQNTPKIPPAYQDSLVEYVSAAQLNELNRPTIVQSATLLQLLQAFGLNEQEKQELQQLYADTQGKVVYHDFWFFGCAPCMAEMPYYNQLMDAAGDSTQFIFLAAHTQKDDFQRVIQKYQLKGRHHLLSKNQLAFYERYFNIKGFPHHQLLNTKGVVVDRRISPFSGADLDQILKLLETVHTEEH